MKSVTELLFIYFMAVLIFLVGILAGSHSQVVVEKEDAFKAGIQWQTERSEYLDRRCEWKKLN